MSNEKKQKILSESLQGMGVSDLVRDDLQNLITALIVQEKKAKEVVLKELKEIEQIVPETVNIEQFVDWLWKFFVDGRMMSYQHYVDAKSIPQNNKEDKTKSQNNKQETLKASSLKSKTSSKSIEVPQESALAHPKQETKKRPAIYDELEKQDTETRSKTDTKKSIFDRIVKNPKAEEKKIERLGIEPTDITKRIKPSNKQTEKNAFVTDQTRSKQVKSSQDSKGSLNNTTNAKRELLNLKSRIVKENNKQEIEVEETEEEQQDINQETQQPEAPVKIKKRCRNWPNCKLGDNCAFHHPTEPCKFFPKCSYGDECLCIHPAISCKFGAFCTRPDCAYLHPNVAMTSMQRNYAPQFGAQSMKPKPKPRQENNVAS